MATYSIWSIKYDESYKTIDDYEYPEYTLTSFLTNYSRDEKKDLNNGRYFNKIGYNQNVKTPSGCYDIPYYYSRAEKGYRLVRSLFYKYCAHHLFYGKMQEYKTGKTKNFINFAQYLPNVSPLCLDFDFVSEFKKSDRSKFKKGDSIHIYNIDHIITIVEILNDIIKNNFDLEYDSEGNYVGYTIKAYVFEKESFKFKSSEVVKDGIHIIYLLPFSLKQRWFIRQELINKLKEIDFIESFNFNITNSYEDIIDEAVVSRNPWLTFGSVKVESKTMKDSDGNTIYYMRNGEKKKKLEINRCSGYNLTHIFNQDFVDENLELIYDENTDKTKLCMKTYETIDDMEAMLNLFDLDQFSDTEPLVGMTDKFKNFDFNESKKNNNSKIQSNIQSFIPHKHFNLKDKFVSNRYTNKKMISKLINHKPTVEALNKIIDYLADDINFTYNNWFMICCGLRNCALECFGNEDKAKSYVHKFCSKDPNFDESNFDDDYDKISSESKKYEGKKSNIYLLINYINNYKKKNDIINILTADSFDRVINSDSSDLEIARYLYDRYKDIMFCTNAEKKNWYVFPSKFTEFNKNVGIECNEYQSIWESSPKGLCIYYVLQDLYERARIEKINIIKNNSSQLLLQHDKKDLEKKSKACAKELNIDANYFNNIIGDQYDKEESAINEIKNRIKKLNILIKKLGSYNLKKNIISECCNRFYNKNFIEEKLNVNEDILCFDNGVYNFKTGIFEDPNQEYYSTFSTRYSYIPNFTDYYYDISDKKTMEVFDEDTLEELKANGDYDPQYIKKGNEIVSEIENYLKKLIVNDDDREYLLKLCASFLTGKTNNQFLHIWTGNGSNGKSMFGKFIETLLGDYHSPISSTTFTRRKTDSQNAQPSLSNKKGVRAVFCNEPDSDDKLHSAIIKELTGQDTLETRGLYSDPIKFKPQFKLIFICNNIPVIDSDDYGTWRRIRIIDFSSSFSDKIKKDDYEHKKFIADKNIQTMVENKTYASCFAWMLINKYFKDQDYDNFTLPEPTESMEKIHREYAETCDPFGIFLDEEFKKVKPEYIITKPPYYIKDTPENEIPSIIYQSTMTTKYTEWAKRNGNDKKMTWSAMKKYLLNNTACKIIKDNGRRDRVIGLRYRKPENNDNIEEDDEF